MQITSGLVSAVVGSQTVTGNASVDWSQVTEGSWLVLSGQIYPISAVNALAKTLTLAEKFAGASNVTNVAYVIVRDFTPNHNLPLLNPGDLEAAALMSRALQTIDQILTTGTGDASLGEFLVTMTGHGFIVGNFLTLSGSTWVLGLSDSVANATLVGCVKEVVDANSFKIVTQGKITGIAGITLTPGSVYFLRDTASAVVGGFVNITDDELEIDVYVPVLQADSPTSGFILNLARANAGRFSQGNDGIVPGPNAGAVEAQSVLCADGVWRSLSVGLDSIQAKHLFSAPVNWTDFTARADGASVHSAILDLKASIDALNSYSRRTGVAFARRTVLNPGVGTGSLTIPARVGSVSLDIYSGSKPAVQVGLTTTITGRPGTPIYAFSGTAVKFTVNVTPGQVLSWNVGQSNGYIDEIGGYPANTQGRVRIYLDGDLVIDLNPLGRPVGSIASPLSYDNTKASFLGYIPWDFEAVAGIYQFETMSLGDYATAIKMTDTNPAPVWTPFAVTRNGSTPYVLSSAYPYLPFNAIAGCAVLTYQQ